LEDEAEEGSSTKKTEDERGFCSKRRKSQKSLPKTEERASRKGEAKKLRAGHRGWRGPPLWLRRGGTRRGVAEKDRAFSPVATRGDRRKEQKRGVFMEKD